MARTASRLSHAAGRGYTLLELVIVVALLLLVLSLSWPSLREMSERREVLSAARMLRGELLRTRLDAIQAGRVREFRFQTGTGEYASGPVSTESLAGGAAGQGEALMAWDPQAGEGDGAARESAAGGSRLPPGVRFADPAEPLDRLAEGTSPPAEESGEWCEPLLFYPNGRTFNARLRLASRRFCVDLTVRGITGSVAVGQVQRVEAEEEPLPEVIVP